MPLVRDELLRLYRLLRLTRTIEDRTRALYYERRIVGGVYTRTGMEGTTVRAGHALRPGAQRAAAYGIPSASVDGNDVIVVHEAVEAAAERARAGGGPSLIEARTFRMRGHSEADNAAYVPEPLLAEWAERDPIRRFDQYLVRLTFLTDVERTAIEASIHAEVEEAVAFALASLAPEASTLAQHVFVDDGSGRIKPPRMPETPA